MDFDEPHSNHLGFGHSTNHPGVNEPNDNMNQAGIDQTSLDLDEIDSQPDFDIGGPFDHPGVSQPHEGKTVQDMMNEDNHGVYQGYIRSHEHAAQLEAEYLAITAAKIAPSIRPESLVDIPRTNEARAHWRERIFYAITDFGNVVNKDRKKSGRGERRKAKLRGRERGNKRRYTGKIKP